MDNQLKTKQHNTTQPAKREQVVVVTHPDHPLHGCPIKVIRIAQSETNPLLIGKTENGSLASIPLEWTSYQNRLVDDLLECLGNLLDTKGLLEVAKIIDCIKKEIC